MFHRATGNSENLPTEAHIPRSMVTRDLTSRNKKQEAKRGLRFLPNELLLRIPLLQKRADTFQKAPSFCITRFSFQRTWLLKKQATTIQEAVFLPQQAFTPNGFDYSKWKKKKLKYERFVILPTNALIPRCLIINKTSDHATRGRVFLPTKVFIPQSLILRKKKHLHNERLSLKHASLRGSHFKEFDHLD